MTVQYKSVELAGSHPRKAVMLGFVGLLFMFGANVGPSFAEDERYTAPKLEFIEKMATSIFIDGCDGHLKIGGHQQRGTCEKQDLIRILENGVVKVSSNHKRHQSAKTFCQSFDALSRASCVVNLPGFEAEFVSVEKTLTKSKETLHACVFKCKDLVLSSSFRFAGSSAKLEPRTRHLEKAVEKLASDYAMQSDVDQKIAGVLGVLNSDSSGLNSADRAIIVELIRRELKEFHSRKSKDLIDAIALRVSRTIDSRLRLTEKQILELENRFDEELAKTK